MAEKPRAAGASDEPSIEEILGSIRRIIAEDEEPGATEEAAEEPLELTNKIEPDGTIVQPKPEIIEEPVVEKPVVAAAPPPAAAPAPSTKISFEEEVTAMPVHDTTDDLISTTTADATAAVMAKLTRRTAIVEEGHDGITIEGMVRQMLRPMLREWLDGHLPDIVEKVVARELERLSKRL